MLFLTKEEQNIKGQVQNTGYPVILASASPRRRQLLQQIGIDFIIDPSSIKETVPKGMLPQQIIQYLALQKARDIAAKYREGLIIGADTIVTIDNDIMGKPRDDSEAFSMLTRLQGRVHQVYTGLVMLNAENKSYMSDYECTRVFFHSLTEEEILRYIKSGEPRGKAGAYAIQGKGALFIEKIEGCYSNVVGLPLHILYIMLKKAGYKFSGV